MSTMRPWTLIPTPMYTLKKPAPSVLLLNCVVLTIALKVHKQYQGNPAFVVLYVLQFVAACVNQGGILLSGPLTTSSSRFWRQADWFLALILSQTYLRVALWAGMHPYILIILMSIGCVLNVLQTVAATRVGFINWVNLWHTYVGVCLLILSKTSSPPAATIHH